MAQAEYAISIKQPWAALLISGRKFIEVRRWPTQRRGRILIHAARVPDSRPQAWKHVPPDLVQAAQLTGGIIGAAQLTGCLTYKTRKAFFRDRFLHLNDPSWFAPPAMFGFIFSAAEELPFRPYPGWIRFFPVPIAK